MGYEIKSTYLINIANSILINIFSLNLVCYLGNVSGKIASGGKFCLLGFIGRCTNGVFIDGWGFLTCCDDFFVTELIRNNNFYW